MEDACRPLTYFWSQFSGAEGTCIDINGFFLALGIVNLINGFYILIILLPQIFGLQTSLKKRLGITCTLTMGGLAMGPILIWSDLEPCIGIVSACLPQLVPLRHNIRSKISSTFASRREETADDNSHQLQQEPSGSTGPMFTYGGSRYFGGGDQSKFRPNDDEVELIHHVSAGSEAIKEHSTWSASTDNAIN
ncbi:hypothetical protein FGRMN_10312 [Fusarium graminum]|nr:hypothetical protein FGRMN_10312 [Fusarium graminum]